MHGSDVNCSRRWLLRVGVALPLVLLGANLLAWLRWGVDLPFLDDWRAYDQGQALSLSPARLFTATNNTIAPVGLALDALAQRWLGGNPLPYQSLSMLGVLGGLLWLQWRLLAWGTPSTQLAAVAMVCTLFMLQSGSYWGEQNLAYHQALPLLALLSATLLNFTAARHHALRAAGVFFLGVVAGLSYVSGAVGALVMGLSWLLLATGLGKETALRARAWQGGAALALAGCAITALQVVLTRRSGADARGQSFALTWPDDPNFWYFMLGKLGRSSGHPFSSTGAEVAWVASLVLVFCGAVLIVVRHALFRRSAWATRLALVWLPLLAVVLVYLALVSLGRAGLRDPLIQAPAEVFRSAYPRFHFFWATLLWPWLAVALGMGVARRCKGVMPTVAGWAALVLIVGLAGMRGIFDVGTHYRNAAEFRAGELRCYSRQLGSGQPVRCPGFDVLDMPDWTRAYSHARDVGASFVRYLPIVEREGFGADLLRLSRMRDHSRVTWRHAEQLSNGWMQTGDDPIVLVSLPGGDMARCRVLGVQLALESRQADIAQLFFRRLGQPAFSEADSVRKPYQPGVDGMAELEFTVDSPTGFAPELRIDHAEGAAQLRLTELRVTCRLWSLR